MENKKKNFIIRSTNPRFFFFLTRKPKLIKTQRPERVKVKFQRLDGSKGETTLSGWSARIFQHEYDHLQGVLFHE